MRNRAKCKLCNDIIESVHSYDYQLCKCGQIGVDGGSELRCLAKDWNNFIRVDDEGNEIIPKIAENEKSLSDQSKDKDPEYKPEKPDKKALVSMLDEMIKSYENLPQNAMLSPITNYDLLSVLILFSALFKAED